MFNRILQRIARASLRVPSPACLIDRLLDRIEILSHSVLAAKAGAAIPTPAVPSRPPVQASASDRLH